MHADIYVWRHARPEDLRAIHALQRTSLEGLGGGFYSPAQLGAALDNLPLVSAELIGEGHFFVLETAGRAIAGCGGWSGQPPAYARYDASGQTALPRALVRSVFVCPHHARRGFGRWMMGRIERDAAEAGVTTLHLTATLSGVPLYRSLGWQDGEATALTFPNGVQFPVLNMSKRIAEKLRQAA